MSDPLFDVDDAATPLTQDEKQGLIPSYITLRRVLNEAEQLGIIAPVRAERKINREIQRHTCEKTQQP